jgi:hypothetical protein
MRCAGHSADFADAESLFYSAGNFPVDYGDRGILSLSTRE